MSLQNVMFLAWHDLRTQLKQGETLLWVFVMPPIFFYFIGMVAGGAASTPVASGTPLTVVASEPGFLQSQLDLRLRDNDFDPEWRVADETPESGAELPARVLTFGDLLSERVVNGETVAVHFSTNASELARTAETIRIRRSLYTALADIAVADAGDPAPLSADALARVNAAPRIWSLDVSAAGQRQDIPSGYEHVIPGILVMFTLIVLLTSGASTLTIERTQGLLRRLASAPLSRREIVAGKWGARMGLAVVQVGSALIVGTLVFHMHWGPDPAMVIAILAAWSAFCASAAIVLGSLASTAAQVIGAGVLTSNLLAALGGCWWPIEITPQWMQALQKLLPTGWAMDALHKLVSFDAGALSAVPHLVALLVAALLLAQLATRYFRFQ